MAPYHFKFDSLVLKDVCGGGIGCSLFIWKYEFLIFLFRDNLLNVHRSRHPGNPLSGLRILDVGCGGGLLTEVIMCVCVYWLSWERRSQCYEEMQTEICNHTLTQSLQLFQLLLFMSDRLVLPHKSLFHCENLLSVRSSASPFTYIPALKKTFKRQPDSGSPLIWLVSVWWSGQSDVYSCLCVC